MKKSLFTVLVSLVTIVNLLLAISGWAQHYIAQPYYNENKIRFYNKSTPVASTPFFTLDIAPDLLSVWGDSIPGINAVVIYNSKIFISYATDTTGGVLIYNFADVYPTRTSTAPVVIKPGTPALGLPTTGIAINPVNGNLYIPTVYTGGTDDAGVYTYSAASNYTSGSQFSSFFSDSSVAAICANLAFDASGNLWMTTFMGDTNHTDNYLICYKGANKYNYYSIVNASSKIYTATSTSGSNIHVHLLSAPEGIAFDQLGNLWLANNNDSESSDNTNFAGQGTLVKINSSWIDSLITRPSTGWGTINPTYIVPTSAVSIAYIPSGKLGGLLFDTDTLYINDQGQTEGTSYLTNGIVWKYYTAGAFDSVHFHASGIHTTYPGNGLMAINNTLFPLAFPSLETVTNTNLLVKPNPVMDNLIYKITSIYNENYNIILVDVFGKIIYTQTIESNIEFKFDMKKLPSGIYTLKAMQTNGLQSCTQQIEKL